MGERGHIFKSRNFLFFHWNQARALNIKCNTGEIFKLLYRRFTKQTYGGETQKDAFSFMESSLLIEQRRERVGGEGERVK